MDNEYTKKLYELRSYYNLLYRLLEVFFSGDFLILYAGMNRDYLRICSKIENILDTPGFEELKLKEWKPYSNLLVFDEFSFEDDWELEKRPLIYNFITEIETQFIDAGEITYENLFSEESVFDEILKDIIKFKKIKNTKEANLFTNLDKKASNLCIKQSTENNIESKNKNMDFSGLLGTNRNLKVENLCFVLMPFSEKFDSIYRDIIIPTVEETGLNCKRADDLFNTGPIIVDIFEYIQKAKVLIADLSEKRPNVFYEVGLAHALEKDVILISQDIDDVPFDLKHRRCIIYKDSVAGGIKLRQTLTKTIENILSN